MCRDERQSRFDNGAHNILAASAYMDLNYNETDRRLELPSFGALEVRCACSPVGSRTVLKGNPASTVRSCAISLVVRFVLRSQSVFDMFDCAFVVMVISFCLDALE